MLLYKRKNQAVSKSGLFATMSSSIPVQEFIRDRTKQVLHLVQSGMSQAAIYTVNMQFIHHT